MNAFAEFQSGTPLGADSPGDYLDDTRSLVMLILLALESNNTTDGRALYQGVAAVADRLTTLQTVIRASAA